MENTTPSTGPDQKRQAPHIPTGDELFREIMGPIEPDFLLSEEEREAKYAGESEEENKARLNRYNQKIAEYKKQYDDRQVQQTSEIRSFGNGLLKDFEEQDAAQDANALESLESQINNF